MIVFFSESKQHSNVFKLTMGFQPMTIWKVLVSSAELTNPQAGIIWGHLQCLQNCLTYEYDENWRFVHNACKDRPAASMVFLKSEHILKIHDWYDITPQSCTPHRANYNYVSLKSKKDQSSSNSLVLWTYFHENVTPV